MEQWETAYKENKGEALPVSDSDDDEADAPKCVVTDFDEVPTTNKRVVACGNATVEIADLSLKSRNFLGANEVSYVFL